MPVKHTFVSVKEDGVDATLVRPVNWNAEHDVALAEEEIPAEIARDTEVAADIATHKEDADAHHDKDHASEHLGAGGDLLSWTDEKLLKGAGAGVAPEEIDVPSGGYTEGARVYNSVNQAIPTGNYYAVTFDSERYDTDGIHSTVSNTSRLTCKTAGKYLIIGQVRFASGGTGIRYLRARVNGVDYIGANKEDEIGTEAKMFMMSTIWDMAVNDYVELMVWQNSGGNLNIVVEAKDFNEFMMQRIG